MRGSFPAGRLFGIPLRIHWSWFFVFALFTAGIARSFLVAIPSPILRVALSALAALAVFASVVLHELGHSVVARAVGVRVRRITVFIFGGVAEILGEPKKVWHEIAIALAGPAVSIALCVMAAIAFVVVRHGAIATTFEVIGVANFLMGTLNLIPALPLDGGRVLRAVLWKITGDHERATEWAAGSGFALAGALGLFGVATILHPSADSPAWNGAWMLVLGGFVARMANGSRRQARLQAALRGGRVRDAMARVAFPAPSESDTVAMAFAGRDAAELLLGFPVARDGAVVGFVEPSSLYALAREAWPTTAIGPLATPLASLRSVAVDDPLDALIAELLQTDGEGALVYDGRDLVGYASRAGLAAWLRENGLNARSRKK